MSNYMYHATDIIARVGDAELLCIECGDESLPPVFANDDESWDDSCGSCLRKISDVL